MKDTSIFQGIKEIGGFRLTGTGPIFHVYKKMDKAFVHIGTIPAKKRSNIALYLEAIKLSEGAENAQ